MAESCRRILAYTQEIGYVDFIRDQKSIDAVVRNIQILGEAANQVPSELREQYPEIEWTKIIRSRNILVHEYFQVDLEIIWKIIEDYITSLMISLENRTH
ncbi:MAG: HepT-like ribonuclease domain-containing protein [Bacteroidota bacterium]